MPMPRQITLLDVLEDQETVHSSHELEYEAPSVHRECKNCWLCVCHSKEELSQPCEGLLFPTIRNESC